MKNKWYTRLIAALLIGTLLIPGAPITANAKNVSEQKTEEETNFGYLPKEKTAIHVSEAVPVQSSSLPSKYMTTLEELKQYPDCRKQEISNCYAHAAVAAAEISMIRQGFADRDSVNYSENAMAYFLYNSVEDPLGGTKGDYHRPNEGNTNDFTTGGSNSNISMHMLSTWNGLVDESVFPNEKIEEVKKKGLDDKYAYSANEAVLKNAYIVNPKDNLSATKKAIMDYGAVILAFYYDPWYCVKHSGSPAYFCNNYVLPNHEVVIVGWDDTFSKENFLNGRRPNADGAWLVRNSHEEGLGFGANQYFWLSYEDYNIDTEGIAFEYMPAETYENNYHYDGSVYSLPTGQKTVSNVFTVQNKKGECLEAVQLTFLRDSDVNYSIDIYKDLKNTKDPTSGTLITSAHTEGKITRVGIFTIELANPVRLDKGCTYSVVLNLENAELGYEAEDSSNLSFKSKGYALPGKSFYYKETEGVWKDLADGNECDDDFYNGFPYGNFKIKSLTNNGAFLYTPEVTLTRVEDEIHVTWKSLSGAKRYELYRKEKGENDWGEVLVSATASDSLTYIDKNVETGVEYCYIVKALGADWVTDIEGEDGNAIILMEAPTNLSVAEGDKGVTLTWDCVTLATSYEVYRKDEGDALYAKVENVKEPTFHDTNLSYGKTYSYKVKAVSKTADGTKCESDTSEAVEIKINTLQTPTNFKAKSAGYNKVKLTWSKSNGASGYYIYRATAKNGTFKKVATVKGGSKTTYTDKNLTNKKRYYYKIVAYNGTKESAQSKWRSATPVLAKSKVSSTVTGRNTSIKISWSKVSEADGYYIYRRKSKKDSWKKVKTITKSTTTSYTDKNKSGSYYYRVCPYKKVKGKTILAEKSNIVRASTLKTASITGTKAKSSTKTITVSWNKVTNATGYEVYYKKSTDKSWKKGKTITSGKTLSAELKLGKKGTYQVKVRAVRKLSGTKTIGEFSKERTVNIK